MKKRTLILLIILTSFALSSSRIAFSRPGPMIKIPYTSVFPKENLFSIGISSDIYNIDPQNIGSTIFFKTFFTQKFGFGFTYATLPNDTLGSEQIPPSEFGLHMQYQIFSHNDVGIALGVHDILFQDQKDSVINPRATSVFLVFSSEKTFEEYKISSFMGLGTGKIGSDPNTQETESSTGGIFVGILFNTPYLKENGGIDLIGEYDGKGINIGANIPVTSDYNLNVGITHFENFGSFGASETVLDQEAPSISFGLTMKIPKHSTKNKRISQKEANLKKERENHNSIFDAEVQRLKDSLYVAESSLEKLGNEKSLLEQNIANFEDSTRVMYLKNHVSNETTNETMKHLAKSLRLYYKADYKGALKETELAIQLNPNLALAYARRGSIYFKLGDSQRAMMNWNMALKIDPEYDEVRQIIKVLKQDKLNPTTN